MGARDRYRRQRLIFSLEVQKIRIRYCALREVRLALMNGDQLFGIREGQRLEQWCSHENKPRSHNASASVNTTTLVKANFEQSLRLCATS